MNRLSRTNFVQNIGVSLELQVIKPYLMFRDSTRPEALVHGLWFHDDADRKAITNQLYKLIKESNAPAAPRAAGVTVGATAGGSGPAPAASDASALPAAAHAGKVLLSLVRGEPPTVAAAGEQKSAPDSGLAPGVDVLFQQARAAGRQAPTAVDALPSASSPVSSSGAAGSSSSSSSIDGVARSRRGKEERSAAAAPPPAASATTSLGEVNILLTRSQLQTVMLDMLRDDDFIRVLHARYMESVTSSMKK